MCLILPRRFLKYLVIEMQKKIGITINLGTIYLDDQQYNKLDAKRIVSSIAEHSGAKENILWRRLRFLGILKDNQRKPAHSALETFNALFETDDQQFERLDGPSAG